ASEVRAIRAHPLVAHRFNEARIADFLVEPLEGVDRTSTFYQNISRLPPAHRITLSADSLSIDHYWQLDPGRELKLGSDAEYTEAFRALLDEAVRARMRCKGQVACMVSGGVDSSTVAAVARDLLVNSGAGPLRVYSGIADDESLSLESQSIRRVLASGGFDSVTIRPGEIGTYEATLRNLFEHLEEPFDNHMTLIQMVYLLGRKHGDRVMLDGVEGDQSHSLTPGYPAYLIRQGHLITAYREVLGLWNNFHYPGDRSVAALLRKSVRPAFVPNWLRRWRNRHLLDRLAAQPLQASCIKPDFADRARIAQRFHRFRNNVGIGLCDSLREQHIRSVEHPFMAVGKERYNRVASLCGIEPRHPLLDKRLVELSISLPWNQKVRHGRSKHLLRLTAEALLPREIAWRQSWENLGWEFTEQRMRLLGDTMRRKCVKMAPQLQRFIDDTLLERVLSSRSSDDQLEDNNLLWEIYSLASWLSRLNDPEH
ncbi:MAG: asparagine synthase-related protein, partial [Gammaproteobacteria bacterium]|nr:asparagine synthase-related protein [Gammaproteobacteria bacterium]